MVPNPKLSPEPRTTSDPKRQPCTPPETKNSNSGHSEITYQLVCGSGNWASGVSEVPSTTGHRGLARLDSTVSEILWSLTSSFSVFEKTPCLARQAWDFCHFPHLPMGAHRACLTRLNLYEDWTEPSVGAQCAVGAQSALSSPSRIQSRQGTLSHLPSITQRLRGNAWENTCQVSIQGSVVVFSFSTCWEGTPKSSCHPLPGSHRHSLVCISPCVCWHQATDTKLHGFKNSLF